jgi:hypothetical protein
MKTEFIDGWFTYASSATVFVVVVLDWAGVTTLRDCIDERGIEVPFKEYTCFYRALFELTAESVRRYARRQSENVTTNRSSTFTLKHPGCAPHRHTT